MKTFKALYSKEEKQAIAMHLKSSKNYTCNCKDNPKNHGGYESFIRHCTKFLPIVAAAVDVIKTDVKLLNTKPIEGGAGKNLYSCPLKQCAGLPPMENGPMDSHLDVHVPGGDTDEITEDTKKLYEYNEDNRETLKKIKEEKEAKRKKKNTATKK